jgi:integrase
MRISVKKFQGVFYRERKANFNGRPDRTYEICWQEGGKKRWKTVGRLSQGVTARDARQVRLEIVSGKARKGASKNPTVADILALAPVKDHVNKRLIIERIGQIKLSDLTLGTLNSFVESLRRDNLSDSSINHYINAISVNINKAIRDRLWEGFNPFSKAAGFRYLVPDNKGERWFTPEEAEKLLGVLETVSPLWKDMAIVSLHSGMRLCEIRRLRVQDISVETATAVVTAKGGRREGVCLTSEALDAILRQGGLPNDFVFRDKNGNPPATSIAFKKAIELLGFNDNLSDAKRKVWFHTLRHTFASWLVQSGVDLYSVQRLMRHGSLKMTQRYAHLDPAGLREPLEIIGHKLNSRQGKTPPTVSPS